MTENKSSLIDSNVLIYAYDKDEKSKNPIAKEFLEDAIKGKTEVFLSTQNLSEFYLNSTEKIKIPLSKKESKEIIKEFLSFTNFTIAEITSESILGAIEISEDYQVPYWDSLIASVMKENDVFSIITENEKDFKKIPWLKVINPFNK